MNEYKFEPEYATDVFINKTGGVTIRQHSFSNEEPVIIDFAGTERAIEVAKAILALVKPACPIMMDQSSKHKPRRID
jgi:hypothetical protein